MGSLFESIRLLSSNTWAGYKISRCLTSDIFGKFRNMFLRKTYIHSNRVLLLMNQVISNSIKRRVSLSVQHQKHYIHLQFKGQNWQDPVDSLLPFGGSENEQCIAPFRVRSKGSSIHLTYIRTLLGVTLKPQKWQTENQYWIHCRTPHFQERCSGNIKGSATKNLPCISSMLL